MTNEELHELIDDCPVLYHMAEHGSWPSIRDLGLLSTTALLDLYEVDEERRATIEARRRPTSVFLERPTFPRAVIRDQIPMDDAGLARCLPPNMTPSDWYRLLNQKVFFWFTRERLLRLLGASAYRDKRHDVLEIDGSAVINAYERAIWFCPMNSGCTKPFPHPRGPDTFLRIPNYPYSWWRRRRKKGERVVELAIDYSVPNIREFVIRVVEMHADTEVKTIYHA